MDPTELPTALDPALVGTYSAVAKSGRGYVWVAVLEYRVWCRPELGAPDEEDGSDYYFSFATYGEALAASQQLVGAEAPLALVLQHEYIDESEPGVYRHVREERITEWQVAFPTRPRRSPELMAAFFSPTAPANGRLGRAESLAHSAPLPHPRASRGRYEGSPLAP